MVNAEMQEQINTYTLKAKKQKGESIKEVLREKLCEFCSYFDAFKMENIRKKYKGKISVSRHCKYAMTTEPPGFTRIILSFVLKKESVYLQICVSLEI